MDYLDFELELSVGSGRDYPVRVLRSPDGEAESMMRFPFDELELNARLKDLEIALLRSPSPTARRKSMTPDEQSVQQFGKALFDALFTGDILARYTGSRRGADAQGKGLRLKLRIRSPELAALPWEFLYDSSHADYICLSRWTPVVRYPEIGQPITPFPVAAPLRILGMVASPTDQDQLDTERERQRLTEAVRVPESQGLLRLEWCTGQRWRDLQHTMGLRGPWHIFHFIGHGAFDRKQEEGILAFAADNGLTAPLRATNVGRVLRDHRSLRLVVLNSCEGARGSSLDMFSSTAATLLQAGIPAVLAMQYEISDRAAITFSHGLYEALAYGMPIDTAVAVARIAVSIEIDRSVEWGTPVLYMRSPDGRLFDVSVPPSVQPAPPIMERVEQSEQRAEPEQQHLNDLSRTARSALDAKQWDRAIEDLSELVTLQPNDQDVRRMLVEAVRQQELLRQWTDGQRAYNDGAWEESIRHFETIVAEDPGYEDAERLLAEARRRQSLATLSAEASTLHQAREWQQVIAVVERIKELDPAYPDAQRLLVSAREHLREQQTEVAPQQRMVEQSKSQHKPRSPHRVSLGARVKPVATVDQHWTVRERCPNCSAPARPGAKFCTTCGCRLPAAAVVARPAEHVDTWTSVASSWPAPPPSATDADASNQPSETADQQRLVGQSKRQDRPRSPHRVSPVARVPVASLHRHWTVMESGPHLTTKQVAELCGTTVTNVQYLARTRALRGQRVNNQWQFLPSDAERYCKEWQEALRDRRKGRGFMDWFRK